MHPCLLTDKCGAERAATRVRQEKWATDLLSRLSRTAKELETDPLPVFEKDWWEEASRKPWSQIYPEVNEHTNFAVVGPVNKAWEAAVAYAAGGDPQHAAAVRKVLLHYTGYEFFAVHPDVGLNWSVWCIRALQAYDLTYDTFAAAERARVDDFLRRAREAVKANDDWWLRDNMGGLYNNHLAWHKLFIGSCGLFYGLKDLVDYAVNADQGIRELIENGCRDDGIWFESSINYHFTALYPLMLFAAELRNAGSSLDLWNSSFANGRSLKSLVTGPINILFADRTLPNIGDAYGRRANLSESALYYAAYDAYGLPEIEWLLSGRSDRPPESLFLERLPSGAGSAPQLESRLWPEHGYAFLRTQEKADYWRGEGFSAFVSYELDSVHSNRDKFSLMVFGRGKHLAIDAEALSTAKHAFSSSIQGTLNRSTVCHNTVMVDGKDHNPIGHKLDLTQWINTDDLKLATISDLDGRVCEGVRMMRTVAATADFVLDVFQVSSEQEHVYDYLFHTYDDDSKLEIDAEFRPAELGSQAPWWWLRQPRQAEINGDWNALARQSDLNVRLHVRGERGTSVTTCDFPGRDDFEVPSIPMLITRRKAKKTVFISVLQGERGPLPDLKLRYEPQRHELVRITVGSNARSYEFSLRQLG